MRTWTHLLTTIVFFAVLAGLGIADAVWTRDALLLPNRTATQEETPPPVTVSKRSGASLEEIYRSLEITAMETNDASLLSRIIGSAAAVHTQVLLKDNDRIALFAWVEDPDVKEEFQAIKDTLHDAFSPSVSGLKDATETPANGAPYNILSFTDPAISDDRIIFLRIRQRLYELHIAQGSDAHAEELLEALSR